MPRPSPSGAPDGFEDFVTRVYPSLVRLGALLSGDAHHGEDLAQTGLVQTLRAWDRLHPHGNPDAYTRTVMTRLAAKAGRRRWRLEQPTGTPPDTAGGSPDPSSIDDALDARRLLAALPAHQRLVLVLRFWMDLSEQQTAEVLACSVGTVKSRTHRGLRALRATAAPPVGVGRGVGRDAGPGTTTPGQAPGVTDLTDRMGARR